MRNILNKCAITFDADFIKNDEAVSFGKLNFHEAQRGNKHADGYG